MRNAAALSGIEAIQQIVGLLKLAVQPLRHEERRLMLRLLDELVTFVEATRRALERGDRDAEHGLDGEDDEDGELAFSERPTVRERRGPLLTNA